MADYKQLYLKLFSETEDLINRLITVQRECEELYIAQQEQEVTLLEPQKTNTSNHQL